MLLDTIEKQPAEVEIYNIDYSKFLAEDDHIVEFIAEVDISDELEVDYLELTKTANIKIAGGLDKAKYKVTLRMRSHLGRVKEDELKVRVKEV